MRRISHNNGNHDARLLYIIELACLRPPRAQFGGSLTSSRAHYGTPSMDARDDVIPADVI